jgi:misacylated tRNA(Ala) deacylase
VTDDLYSRDAYLATCQATDEGAVVLDRTVFYARGGGQPGDSGILRWGERTVAVTDTVKDRESGEWSLVGWPGWISNWSP